VETVEKPAKSFLEILSASSKRKNFEIWLKDLVWQQLKGKLKIGSKSKIGEFCRRLGCINTFLHNDIHSHGPYSGTSYRNATLTTLTHPLP
jgi:hypothetical protein